jgi:excisionase family DNA binding protein
VTKVKNTLRNILEKVETGKVTIEDIQTAQSILESSIIISPRSVLRRGSLHLRKRRQYLEFHVKASAAQPEDYYTVQEVAKRFNVSDKAVYKWIDQKKIQFERSNENSRDIRIPKSQFKNPPSKETVDKRENELFKDAVEMELVRRKDLFRDEEK